MIRSDVRFMLVATIVSLLSSAPVSVALAQPCEPEWRAVEGLGPGTLAMTVWDPPGGAGPKLVVGGWFTQAGGIEVNHIAAWDLATGEWSALGAGTSDVVRALAVMPSGDLIAGGSFTQVGGIEDANWIARWDGERWHGLGAGMGGAVSYWEFPGGAGGVHALAVSPTGDLFAGGNFTRAGSATATHIARWDGEDWQSLLGGMSWDGTVFALEFLTGGDLVAGGWFHAAGGVAAQSVARWDGALWRPMGSGLTTPGFPLAAGVWSLSATPHGEMIAGGPLVSAGSEPIKGAVARWDGDAWRSIGEGPRYISTSATLVHPDGSVFVSGWESFERSAISRWDGERWTDLPGSVWAKALILLPTGEIAAGGHWTAMPLAIWRDCPSCYADCDGDGELTFFDFLCFQNLFAAGDPLADCDESGQLDFFDFLCFQNEFAGGCE